MRQRAQTEAQEVLLNIKEHFFTEKVTEQWHKVAQRSSGVSIHGDITSREVGPAGLQKCLQPHWEVFGARYPFLYLPPARGQGGVIFFLGGEGIWELLAEIKQHIEKLGPPWLMLGSVAPALVVLSPPPFP